ncbi:tyrosine kinase receptor Cad96Ca-like [Saccoglossus kowalevskii]
MSCFILQEGASLRTEDMDEGIPFTNVQFREDLLCHMDTKLIKSEVRVGLTQIVPALIKVLKDDANRINGRKYFLKEMKALKSIPEDLNIISLLGYCQEPECIVMEYCQYGDLKSYLKQCKISSNFEGNCRDIKMFVEFLNFAMQIANGLSYLAERDCILRSLAAKNIQVGKAKTCKIADLGMSTAVIDSKEFEARTCGRLPLRWMAIESIMDCVYTTKSDIWSYGIVMWEIFNFGDTPYPEMTPADIIHELQQGYKMPKPSSCSVAIYTMMTQCWNETPSTRPECSDIISNIYTILCKTEEDS